MRRHRKTEEIQAVLIPRHRPLGKIMRCITPATEPGADGDGRSSPIGAQAMPAISVDTRCIEGNRMTRLVKNMTVRNSEIGALLLATVLFGISAPAYSAAGSVPLGRVVAMAYCSACHAIGPSGASPHSPAPPFRTFHEKYDVEGFAEKFADGVVIGHAGPRRMPKLMLSRAEIDDLIAYLKSLEPQWPAPGASSRKPSPKRL